MFKTYVPLMLLQPGAHGKACLPNVDLTTFTAPHPSVVQPVASRYTDYTIPAPQLFRTGFFFNKILQIILMQR
jgi:hypothetical protein